eukprot:TRINITY_DN3162_c0_g1_i2.p1 TRINITY_DN3162_c0_g1~~TRINITY_DN3162_c0_g1_i2.p1  ORF type:complete len:570 (+),score=163.03 TRINITY_DN3162_c0_g1_i2:107-1816(+)
MAAQFQVLENAQLLRLEASEEDFAAPQIVEADQRRWDRSSSRKLLAVAGAAALLGGGCAMAAATATSGPGAGAAAQLSARALLESTELADAATGNLMRFDTRHDPNEIHRYVESGLKTISHQLKVKDPAAFRQLEALQLSSEQRAGVVHVVTQLSDDRVQDMGYEVYQTMHEDKSRSREELKEELMKKFGHRAQELRELRDVIMPASLRGPAAAGESKLDLERTRLFENFAEDSHDALSIESRRLSASSTTSSSTTMSTTTASSTTQTTTPKSTTSDSTTTQSTATASSSTTQSSTTQSTTTTPSTTTTGSTTTAGSTTTTGSTTPTKSTTRQSTAATSEKTSTTYTERHTTPEFVEFHKTPEFAKRHTTAAHHQEGTSRKHSSGGELTPKKADDLEMKLEDAGGVIGALLEQVRIALDAAAYIGPAFGKKQPVNWLTRSAIGGADFAVETGDCMLRQNDHGKRYNSVKLAMCPMKYAGALMDLLGGINNAMGVQNGRLPTEMNSMMMGGMPRQQHVSPMMAAPHQQNFMYGGGMPQHPQVPQGGFLAAHGAAAAPQAAGFAWNGHTHR